MVTKTDQSGGNGSNNPSRGTNDLDNILRTTSSILSGTSPTGNSLHAYADRVKELSRYINEQNLDDSKKTEVADQVRTYVNQSRYLSRPEQTPTCDTLINFATGLVNPEVVEAFELDDSVLNPDGTLTQLKSNAGTKSLHPVNGSETSTVFMNIGEVDPYSLPTSPELVLGNATNGNGPTAYLPVDNKDVQLGAVITEDGS